MPEPRRRPDFGPCTRKGPERSRLTRRLLPCPNRATDGTGRCDRHFSIEAHAYFERLEAEESRTVVYVDGMAR
jgi:hypothetical protein